MYNAQVNKIEKHNNEFELLISAKGAAALKDAGISISQYETWVFSRVFLKMKLSYAGIFICITGFIEWALLSDPRPTNVYVYATLINVFINSLVIFLAYRLTQGKLNSYNPIYDGFILTSLTPYTEDSKIISNISSVKNAILNAEKSVPLKELEHQAFHGSDAFEQYKSKLTDADYEESAVADKLRKYFKYSSLVLAVLFFIFFDKSKFFFHISLAPLFVSIGLLLFCNEYPKYKLGISYSWQNGSAHFGRWVKISAICAMIFATIIILMGVGTFIDSMRNDVISFVVS